MSEKIYDDERIDQLMRYDLEIIQSASVFSFSLDALLLDDFTSLPSHNRAKIVDLCSGNGVIALLLSQHTQSKIIGVELQERLVNMANRSIRLNGLENKVSMLQTDVSDVFNYIPADSVDVITCNPPYFPVSETSRKNPNEHLAIARHEIHTNLDEVIKVTSQLLKMNGRAYFVYRPSRLLEMIDTFKKYHLTPKEIRFIYAKDTTDANMMLVKVMKHGKESGLKVLPPLRIHDEKGEYLLEVRKIIYGEV